MTWGKNILGKGKSSPKTLRQGEAVCERSSEAASSMAREVVESRSRRRRLQVLWGLALHSGWTGHRFRIRSRGEVGPDCLHGVPGSLWL